MSASISRRILVGSLLCFATCPAYATGPAEVLDIPGNTNGVTPTTGSYQTYTVNFNAVTTSTEVTFLFRNDPSYTSLDSISLQLNGSGGNLLQNGGFESGPTPGHSNQPLNWNLVGTQGLGAAGVLSSGTPNGGTVGLPFSAYTYAGSYLWIDGAVGGFDGIAQTVTTIIGDSYTLTFELGAYVSAWSSNSVETQVYAGAGLPGGIILTSLPDIDTATGYYLASGLGSVENPAFTGGTLKIDTASPVTQNFTVDSTGGAIDAAGFTSVFSGVLSDSGTPGGMTIMDSVGGGTIVLNGANTYNGTTTVASGTLEVGDSSHSSATLDGNVIVDNGATLRGHGTIGGNVTNSGTVAPGGSIGTTTITGNYVQNSNGNLNIELNPSSTSLLAVTGSASLAGTLTVTPDAGTYTRGTVYQILTAGSGVSGTFTTPILLTAGYSGFYASLYGANFVDLTATTAFGYNGTTADQRNIGNALDSISPNISSGPMNTILNAAYGLAPSAQGQALDELTDHIATRTQFAANNNLRLVTGSVVTRITNIAGLGDASGAGMMGENGPAVEEIQVADAGTSDAPGTLPKFGNGMTAWMQGIGSFGSIGATDAAPGETSSTGGVALGLEKHLMPGTHAGLVFSTTHDSIDLNNVSQNGSVMSYALGVYGSSDIDNLFTLDGSVIGSYNHATTHRQIALVNEAAIGYSDGFGVGIDAGVSKRYELDDNVWILPRFALDYTHMQQGAFTETGAPGDNISVGTQAQSYLQSDLGATFDARFELSGDDDDMIANTSGDVIRPQFHIGWLHEWINPNPQAQESFADITASPAFTTYGADPGRNAASIALSVNYTPAANKDMSIYLGYNADVSGNGNMQTVTGGFKYSW